MKEHTREERNQRLPNRVMASGERELDFCRHQPVGIDERLTRRRRQRDLVYKGGDVHGDQQQRHDRQRSPLGHILKRNHSLLSWSWSGEFEAASSNSLNVYAREDRSPQCLSVLMASSLAIPPRAPDAWQLSAAAAQLN